MDIIEKALKKRRAEAGNTVSAPAVETVPFVGKGQKKNIASIDATIENIELDQLKKSGIENSTSQAIEIDTTYLSEQGILIAGDESTQISDEFRRIKGPLLKNIKGKSAHPIERANLIQVTSSLQSEGKTFNAINLAMSIAMELDFKVLLVDADILKPSVSKALNIDTDKGLVEYLSGDVTQLSDVLLSTNIPKLTVLPAGNKHKLSVELFNSDAMRHLFNEMSERYSDRVVIIDSPPVLQTNESSILAHNVGQIVFVIEHNTTTVSDVENAIAKLPADAVIGVVLNKSRTGQTDGYGYGYGYGYGSE